MGVKNICCITFLKLIKKSISDDVPANIYWFKVIKKNTRSCRRSDVFILNSNHISHHFRVTIGDLNRKTFICIVSSNYESISIYIDFFQTITRSCQVHVQATSLFKIISIGIFQKKAIFCYF